MKGNVVTAKDLLHRPIQRELIPSFVLAEVGDASEDAGAVERQVGAGGAGEVAAVGDRDVEGGRWESAAEAAQDEETQQCIEHARDGHPGINQ